MDSKLDPVILEWAYAREMMRRLGFSADDLFMQISKNIPDKTRLDGEYLINLILKTQGKEFVWTIASTSMTKEDVHAQYDQLCGEWNSGLFNEEEFKSSKAFRQTIGLIRAIDEKGIKLNIEDLRVS